jgi:hypothetical protein
MATAAFANVTFWNDSASGIDRLEAVCDERRTRYGAVRQPRGGIILKKMGIEPARVVLRAQYSLNDTSAGTVLTNMAAMDGVAGTLTFPQKSFSNMVLMRAVWLRGGPHQIESGAIEFRWIIEYEFQQLR